MAKRGGIERLTEVIAQLEGPLPPASVLEREILPARVPGYVPRLLDELGTAGEVCWVGQGRLGRDDGRIALYRPDRLALLTSDAAADPPVPDGEAGDMWLRDVLLAHLSRRGASFYRDLLGAGATAARDVGRSVPAQRGMLDALWDLVWSRLVTNDTFAPLRALRWARRSTGGERGHRRLRRSSPLRRAGRWSLVADARSQRGGPGGTGATSTERRTRWRCGSSSGTASPRVHGIAAEAGISGGFGAVYPILARAGGARSRPTRLSSRGSVAPSSRQPGAVDRLRAAQGPLSDEGADW